MLTVMVKNNIKNEKKKIQWHFILEFSGTRVMKKLILLHVKSAHFNPFRKKKLESISSPRCTFLSQKKIYASKGRYMFAESWIVSQT